MGTGGQRALRTRGRAAIKVLGKQDETHIHVGQIVSVWGQTTPGGEAQASYSSPRRELRPQLNQLRRRGGRLRIEMRLPNLTGVVHVPHLPIPKHE